MTQTVFFFNKISLECERQNCWNQNSSMYLLENEIAAIATHKVPT